MLLGSMEDGQGTVGEKEGKDREPSGRGVDDAHVKLSIQISEPTITFSSTHQDHHTNVVSLPSIPLAHMSKIMHPTVPAFPRLTWNGRRDTPSWLLAFCRHIYHRCRIIVNVSQIYSRNLLSFFTIRISWSPPLSPNSKPF